MNISKESSVFKFTYKNMQYWERRDLDSGEMDQCQFRLIFLRSILITFVTYWFCTIIGLGILATYAFFVLLVNMYFGENVDYMNHLPPAFVIFMLISSIATLVIGFGKFVEHYGQTCAEVIQYPFKKIKKNLPAKTFSKGKPDNSVKEMWKSWKDKYCTKVNIVE